MKKPRKKASQVTKIEKEISSIVIKVENLVKSYGSIKAVNDISFQVMQGEAFGMLGPNGAGKTTTAEIIEGLRRADSGKVFVLGLDIARVPAKIKQRIGIQLQAVEKISRLHRCLAQKSLALFRRRQRGISQDAIFGQVTGIGITLEEP